MPPNKMSLFASFVRDVVEPLALTLLEWAWTFDPTTAPPLFSLPLRFYAYSSTSVLLWMYELLPHWLILTLILFGVLFVIQLTLSLICFPISTLCSILKKIAQGFFLLFRGLLECLISAIQCFRRCWLFPGVGCRRRRVAQQAVEAQRVAVPQLAQYDLPAWALNAPANFRVLPAPPPFVDDQQARNPRPAPRNNRRRISRSPRRRN